MDDLSKEDRFPATTTIICNADVQFKKGNQTTAEDKRNIQFLS
ncbi:hypothetical protein [Mesobacillus foraminis]|nr:hypothetical protein [Mesobacillus foraminis]